MSSTVTYKGSTIASVSNTTKTLETAGKYMEDDVTITDVSQATPVLQTVSKSYTPSETAQSEDVTAGSGYDGLEKVSVSVGAISSSYVGSGITRRSSSDMTASGATVTAPSGYYENNGTKSVASGTVTAPASISATGASVSTGTNTLTLSKTVSVTPNVTTAGYISSGTAGNSSVSLTANITPRSSSDLTASGATVTAPAGYYGSSASKAVATGSATAPASISGTSATVSTSGTSTLTLSKTVSVTPSVSAGYVSSGTAGNSSVSLSASVNIRSSSSLSASGDTVTAPAGYYASAATKAVAAGTAGTPTATKGTVSNHSVSVTPSVTNTTGYITGSTKTGTAVTVTASELASGNKAITSNGTGIDVVGFSTVSVEVAGGGSGSVYQDAEGYLVLSDEPGTHVEIDELQVTQNGTYTASTGHAYSPVVVNVSGGGGVEEKQVNFFDYDGTLLYSYTAAEIEEMTDDNDLPANPSHEGMDAQGWNWTVTQLKTQLTACPDGVIDVGQAYFTTSTATEIDITLDDPNYLSPYLAMGTNGCTVDWGDGSQAEEITGSGVSTIEYIPHTYPAIGDYTITITRKPYDGTNHQYSFSTGNQNYAAILVESSTSRYSVQYSRCIKHIRLGYGIKTDSYSRFGEYEFCNLIGLETFTFKPGFNGINDYAFYNCKSLSFIVLHGSTNRVGSYAFCYSGLRLISRPGRQLEFGLYGQFGQCRLLERFTFYDGDRSSTSGGVAQSTSSLLQNCTALKKVYIPSGAYAFGYKDFYYCDNLTDITIPTVRNSISQSALEECRSLRCPITIPTNVTTIGEYAFRNCYSIPEYHVLATSPPACGVSAFDGILYTDTIIYVPYSADHSVLAAYQSATNWSVYSSHIQEEPQ